MKKREKILGIITLSVFVVWLFTQMNQPAHKKAKVSKPVKAVSQRLRHSISQEVAKQVSVSKEATTLNLENIVIV